MSSPTAPNPCPEGKTSRRATWTTGYQTLSGIPRWPFPDALGQGSVGEEPPRSLSRWGRAWACLPPQNPSSCLPHPAESLQPARVWPTHTSHPKGTTVKPSLDLTTVRRSLSRIWISLLRTGTFCCNKPPSPPVLWFPLAVLLPGRERWHLCPAWKVFGTWGGENGSSYKRFC